MAKNRKDYYFIELNLQRDKHAELIEWIKKKAGENEQSLSSFCIKILKDLMGTENGNNN